MSWTDEELDGLVRDAAGSSHVEYKEAYWHEMEALLGQKSGSKIGLWWWLSGITLLMGWSTIFVGSINGVFGSKEQLLADSQLKQREQIALIENDNSNIQQIETTTSRLNNQSESKEYKGNLSENNANNNDITKNETQFVMNDSQPTESVKSQKVNSSKQASTSNSKQAKSANEPLAIVSNSKAEDSNLILEKSNAVTPPQILGQDLLKMKNWENEPTMDPLNSFDKLPLFAGKRIGFYAGFNSGIGQSYVMTKTNNELYQFAINGGVEFYKGNWAFGTGLGLRQQFTQNLDVINHRRYYSYGSVSIDQNVTYDRLVFADLNLNVSRRFGRSEIGLNVSPTYMLGARMSALQKTEEITGSNKLMWYEETGKKEYVRSSNFNPFGLNTGIQYSFMLMKNTYIQAGVSVRFIQPLANSNFNGENRNIPMMFELGLKKRF